MMEDDILTVGAALRTINQASHYALASFTPELYEANHVISEALLNRHQRRHLDTDEYRKSNAAENEGNTTLNDKATQAPTQSENQNTLHTKVWLGRSETALVKLAEYWLHTRAIDSEHRGRRSDLPLILRKAIISNSPAVLAVLRKFYIKRKRLVK
jgi:predicted ATPase